MTELLPADSTGPRLGPVLLEYLDRVVNRQDISGVDDLVSASYAGSGFGWPADATALRRFYEEQYRDRPDWRIDVQEVVELGTSVVARALAGGRARAGAGWESRRLEWLAHYRFHEGRIVEIHVLELVARDADA